MITSKFKKGPPELIEALLSVRKHFIYAGAFSAAVNILLLVPIMYMMLVYDRVLSSGSMSTLGMLTLLMVMLLVAIGAFEWVRTYILIAASNFLGLACVVFASCISKSPRVSDTLLQSSVSGQ